jgi:hypothetical protein
LEEKWAGRRTWKGAVASANPIHREVKEGVPPQQIHLSLGLFNLIESDTVLTRKHHPTLMTELSDLTKKELIAKAEELELDIGGNKTELLERIEAHLASLEAPAEEVVEEVEEAVEEVVEEVVEEAPAKPLKKGALPPVDTDMDPEAFVALAYQAVLKREADAGGLRHYTSMVAMGSLTKQQVLDDLAASDEAQSL